VDRHTADVFSGQRHLAAVNPNADRDTNGCQRFNQRQAAADRALSAVEHDQKRVPGGLDLAAAEADQHGADDIVVHCHRLFPGCVAGLTRLLRRADYVGEQNGGHHARALARVHVESGAAGPVDHHQLLVALHPGEVPGWQVEHLVGPDDYLLALVGPDAHSSTEDNAPVIELARGGTGLGLRVGLPAPARLQDMVADHCSGQAHLVGRT